MFKSKKKKIQLYLDGRQKDESTIGFDCLLRAYLCGELKRRIEAVGIKSVEIYIDWLEQFRCINVQGKYGKFYVDIQIEPEEFSIGCDDDEPDDHGVYSLKSEEQFYQIVQETCESVK